LVIEEYNLGEFVLEAGGFEQPIIKIKKQIIAFKGFLLLPNKF